ncbi:MAG: hypothetical protein E7289_01560 [Lachnospiraceae bacterium]|nr:hypothetical protein [Lachnospiraceae bacterium]
MDITLLFMKMEDKYWGIFLVAVFFLFVCCRMKNEQSGKKLLFTAVYGIVSYLVFLCPLTYALTAERFPALATYYEISYAQLVVPILVLAGTVAVQMAEKEGKRRGIVLLVAFFVLLVAAGDFAYVPTVTPEWAAESSRREAEAFDLILDHAKGRGDEDVRIWGMDEMMAKCRLYDDDFTPIYGKDMKENPERYSQALQTMHQGYARYDVDNGTSINIGDQLDALAGLPYLFPETGCEYVILYDPAKQFEDFETYFGEDGFDAVSRFSALGYEPVGRTETMLLFYKQEG